MIKIDLFCRYTISLLTLIILALVAPLSHAAPCPQGSEGDHPFRVSNINKCVWMLNEYHMAPSSANMKAGYNIYCPGRMSQAQANDAGKRIVAGASIREKNPAAAPKSPNIVQQQYARIGSKPVYGSTPHVFQYGCVINGKAGVATHILVRTVGNNFQTKEYVRDLPQKIANSCRKINQSGVINRPGRADVQYRCSPIHDDKIYYTREAAVLLMQKSYISEARKNGLKICVLNSTATQTFSAISGPHASDNLIVRIYSVSPSTGCGNDTFKEIY